MSAAALETGTGTRRSMSVKDFIERSRHGRWPVRVASWLLMIVIAIGATVGMATMAHATPDDDELAGQLSFYSLASTTATFFSDSLAPDGKKRLGMWDDIMGTAANAGSMLGYSDKNRDNGSNWVMSMLTTGSHTMSYSAFADDPKLQGALDYVQFGATLSGLGLDSSTSGSGINMTGFVGLPLIGFYNVNGWVAGLFSGLISLLQTLNPFLLFHAAAEAINPEFAAGMVQESHPDYEGLNPALQTVAEFIGGIYGALNGLAWAAMVPIFFGLLVVGIMFRGSKFAIQGGGLKKFVIRLVFIGFGLPLVGSMYTMTLNGLSEAVDSDNAPAAQKIMEAFVDFENWSKHYALAVPSGTTIEWNERRSRPTDASIIDIRNTANSINRMVNPNIKDSYQGLPSFLYDSMNKPGIDAAVRDLLNRYREGNKVTGPDFETSIKSSAMAAAASRGTESTLKEWFTGVSNDSLGDAANPIITGNGVLMGVPDTGLLADRGSTGSQVVKFKSQVWSKCEFTGVPGRTSCNLAPMAMYNYLNTTFGPESYTVFSAEKSTSFATRDVHSSVNLVGDGFTSVLFWTETLVTLVAFVIIGLGYLIGMLMSNVRRTIQLVSAIPFATLGAIAGIAKVIVYSMALIVEVVATLFIYVMVQEFLINIPALVGGVFADMMTNSSGSVFIPGVSGDMVLVASLVISIVFIVLFMIMALRVRKTVIKAVEEAVTKLVNKFMDSNVGAPGGGGQMMPALAGGMAAGAGASAMNKAMGGKAKSGGPKGSAGGTGGGSGPAPVGTGGGGGGNGGPPPPGGGGGDGGGGNGGPPPPGGGGNGGGGGGNGGPPPPGGGGGNGGGGNGGPPPPGGVNTDTATTDKGKEVAANGLSDPTAAAGANQDDAMSGMSTSMEDSAQKYQEADRAKVGVATEGAKAVAHGAVAAGAAAAGDAKTATEHGGKAVAAGAEAKARAHESKAKADGAGRSSLDKPSSGKQAQKAQQARQVRRAAGAVGRAAGAANGGKGGSAGGAPRASQGGSLQRQQAPRPAPAPAPRRQAPRPAPAPKAQGSQRGKPRGGGQAGS